MERLFLQAWPPLILGGRFGERPAETDFALLDAWLETGGRVVETAHDYAGGAGERRIGDWLRARVRADAPLVITKVGHPTPDGTPTLGRASLRRQLETSLRRLGVARVDLLLLHRDDLTVPVEELAGELQAAVTRGDAAAVGVANWTLPRLKVLHALLGSALAAASEQWSLARPVVAPYPGTVAADDAMLAWHAASGVPLLAWSANAGGWFAGRGARGSFDTPENRSLRDAVRHQARALGVAPATVALHHTLHAGPRIVATVGPETRAELAEAVAALRLGAPSLQVLGSAAS